MRVFSKTDVGMKREINQDSVFSLASHVGKLPNLFIVADGMGGHKGGDYASGFAVREMVENISTSEETDPESIIKSAIEKVNAGIYAESQKIPELNGMGTTLVAATVVNHTLYFANVGDSRLYVLGETIRQISKDHSLVEEMVRLGSLSEADAENHPDKNIITRAVGSKEEVEVDFFEYHLDEGDLILMCTDGLSNMLSKEEIFAIVKGARDTVEGVSELIEAANDKGGLDNIGVVLVEPFSEEIEVEV